MPFEKRKTSRAALGAATLLLALAPLAGCGGGSKTATSTATRTTSGQPGGAIGERLKSPTFKRALESFAACLRQNGVDVGPPDTSGKGPIFDSKAAEAHPARLRAAQRKCAHLLRVRPGGASTSG